MRQIVLNAVTQVRTRARQKRAAIFRRCFPLDPKTKILDVGSEDGSNIAMLLRATPVKPGNVYIAYISEAAVKRGHDRYGFVPVPIPETGRLPFEDSYFDIVYCSSVIEHVTLPKADIWAMRSGRDFRERAWERQREFAREIARLGKAYFVQTPNKWFPIESHTWLPFVGYLPRNLLVPLIGVTNRVWIKRTSPDWSLLSVADMQRLFPEAEIIREEFLGLTKSLMAIKRR